MTFQNELTLILVGAAIALISSVATTIVTALISYRLDRRRRKEARKEQALQTLGQLSARVNATAANIRLKQDIERVLKILESAPSDDHLDALIGFGLGWLEVLDAAGSGRSRNWHVQGRSHVRGSFAAGQHAQREIGGQQLGASHDNSSIVLDSHGQSCIMFVGDR